MPKPTIKVASKIDANENDYRLKLFNAMLEGFLEDQQQSICKKFDITKVYNELSDLFVEFCWTNSLYAERGV